jgi:hypothetical protein
MVANSFGLSSSALVVDADDLGADVAGLGMEGDGQGSDGAVFIMDVFTLSAGNVKRIKLGNDLENRSHAHKNHTDELQNHFYDIFNHIFAYLNYINACLKHGNEH